MATSPVSYGDAFGAAVDFVIDRLEGGDRYTDHPDDAGGATRWGITKRSHPEIGDARNLTRADAVRIYYESYWLPCHGDNLQRALALILFAAAVNIGPRNAIKCLQRAIDLVTVKVDGVFGPRTVGAARRFDPQSELRARLTGHCAKHYCSLAESYPRSRLWLQGWLNRVGRVADEAGKWGSE